LDSARKEGKEYIDAICSDDILIFDVSQPENFDKKYGRALDLREELENTIDFVCRDRIYVDPQYLHVHLRKLRLTKREFERKKKKLSGTRIDGVSRVYLDRSRQGMTDLAELILEWARRNGFEKVNPTLRQIDSVPIELDDGNYIALKLVREERLRNNYIIFTIKDPYQNLKKYEDITLDIVRLFEGAKI
jgi:hypothetical protein